MRSISGAISTSHSGVFPHANGPLFFQDSAPLFPELGSQIALK